jgi:GGDEF domain-containing protein
MKLFKKPGDDGGIHDYDLDEVKAIASQGRRLAIYDRETQLYAYWYLQLRAEEEISRGKRNGRGVICLSMWAPNPPLIDALCGRLRAGLRNHDLAAYLNNGHFVALLTETDAAGAQIVMDRLLASLDAGVTGGIACFPEDATTFDELLECAKARAASPASAEDAA